MGSDLIGFWDRVQTNVGLKKFFTPVATDDSLGHLLPQTRYNYQASYGNSGALLRSSAVGACVNWMARTFPEADLSVRRFDSQTQQYVTEADHPLRVLLNRPNPYFSGRLVRMALATDFIVNGNAFLIKVRAANGGVVQLWWAPAETMTPQSESKHYDNGYLAEAGDSSFITHYEYSVGSGASVELPTEDVIHCRYGIDPDNTRLGRSPLASVFRELFTDDEAANFTASLLRNSAIPGVVLAPGEGVGAVSDEDLEGIRDKWADQFGSDNRGRLMIMRGATKVTPVSFSPHELNLRELRRIPEERVSAVLGVPAIVAGLGAGLDRSTFSNMAEAREQAWESGLIPIQALIADDLSSQLLPDFDDDKTAEVFFDYQHVRVLQADATDLARRWRELVEGSIAKRSEARAALDMPINPGDDVYLLPMNKIEVGGDAPPPPEDDEKYDVIVEHNHSNGVLDDPDEVAASVGRLD
jgi:HK97 family phage portal protein|tara:strand:- start:12159 stop:13568 length:1410 start_codon:yes stop_codon:yes gene_type:complete